MSSEDQKTIRQYLLQELEEEEQKRVEEKMMTDDAFFEEITFAEDELVEEYTRGALGGVERKKFEHAFLTTPEGRLDVTFNKAFGAHILKAQAAVADVAPKPRPVPRPKVSFWRSQPAGAAFALAVIIILAALSAWLVVAERQRRSEIDRLQAEVQRVEKELADHRNQASQLQQDIREARERNSDLERQLASLKDARDHINQSESLIKGILSVVLSPGRIRGSGTEPLRIPPDKHTVEFRLRVPSPDYVRYSADIVRQGAESLGHSALKVRRVGSETQAILRLPAAKVTPGAYEIKLLGTTAQGKTETINSYYFNVVK
jgi:hypothetical protein